MLTEAVVQVCLSNCNPSTFALNVDVSNLLIALLYVLCIIHTLTFKLTTDYSKHPISFQTLMNVLLIRVNAVNPA